MKTLIKKAAEISSALIWSLNNSMNEKIKKYLKNPDFYYITVPVIIAVWTIFVWTVALPASQKKWDREEKQYNDAKKLVTEILTIDPERLNYKDQGNVSGEFDYTTTVDQFARLCAISPTNYSLMGGREIKHGGKKSKSADIIINETDVENLAKFISGLLIRWPDLQCEQLKLTKLKSGPDKWKATLKFTYYY